MSVGQCLGNNSSQYFNVYYINAGESSWFDQIVFGAEYPNWGFWVFGDHVGFQIVSTDLA